MKIENISRGLKKRTFGEFEMNNDVLAFEPVPSGKSHRYLLEITSRGSIFFTHPRGHAFWQILASSYVNGIDGKI